MIHHCRCSCFRRQKQSPSNITLDAAEEAVEVEEDTSGHEKEIGGGNVRPGSPLSPLSPLALVSLCQNSDDLPLHLPSSCDQPGDLCEASPGPSSRQDSIVELYCDDEFTSPHLGLSTTDLGQLEDILDMEQAGAEEVVLPFSLPSLLQDSFKDNSFEWDAIERDLRSTKCLDCNSLDVSNGTYMLS